MRPSGQLVTSDTIKFQWRLPEPVLPADHPMLTAPILPMLVRFSLPNMMAMLAMALVAISRGGTGHDGDVILQKSGGRGNAGIGAGRQFAGGARRAAIERRLGGGERGSDQPQQRQRNDNTEYAAIRYFFSSSSRCLTSRSSSSCCWAISIRIAILILGAGLRGGLLDELPDVVARDGNALFEFGKRKRRAPLVIWFLRSWTGCGNSSLD